MAKGFKTGGRLPGGSTKKKQAFREALRAYATRKKVDPHIWMVDMLADMHTIVEAVSTDAEGVVHHIHTPVVPLALKLSAAMELAQYLEPKLRSIVLSGDAANPVQILQALPEEQFEALLQRRLAEAGYGPLGQEPSDGS